MPKSKHRKRPAPAPRRPAPITIVELGDREHLEWLKNHGANGPGVRWIHAEGLDLGHSGDVSTLLRTLAERHQSAGAVVIELDRRRGYTRRELERFGTGVSALRAGLGVSVLMKFRLAAGEAPLKPGDVQGTNYLARITPPDRDGDRNRVLEMQLPPGARDAGDLI